MVEISYDSSVYRCSAGQYVDRGSPNSDESLDGILGFGKSNSSVISQLASSGQVKKMFAHCLDGVNGGGIFAIGTIVKPRVNTTPLLQNEYVVLTIYIRVLPCLFANFLVDLSVLCYVHKSLFCLAVALATSSSCIDM